MEDCYKVLGVARDASMKDINTAYKKLALKYHPDKSDNHNDTLLHFRKIQEAIEVLRDPAQRAEHDNSLPYYEWETSYDGFCDPECDKIDDNSYDYDQSRSYDYGEFMDWQEATAEESRQEEEQAREYEQQREQEREKEEKLQSQAMREWRAKRTEAMRARVLHDGQILDLDEQDEPEICSDIPIYEGHEICYPATDGNKIFTDSNEIGNFCSKSYTLIDLSDSSEEDNQGGSSQSGIEELLGENIFFGDEFVKPITIENNQINPDLYEGVSRFFRYKLANSGGQYGFEDLQMEVVGFHLESMQQYFQDLRNRFISSNKIVSNDRSAHKCSHSGPWQKDFGLENCDVCGRWMPLYTLSCPSCQIKACISCKYH